MRRLLEKYNSELCGSPEVFSEEAIRTHIEERKAHNPTNLIKALHVLEYLGQLRKEGLDPLFRGGSAVQLLLPEGWQRLSIDIDLATESSKEDVERAMRGIYERFGGEYYSYESRESEFESDVPFHNYRITIPTFEGSATILLDIMGAEINYRTQRKQLRSFFYQSEVEVKTPTINAILGDKLSTLGPETIGRHLRDSRNGMEYVKHIYDIRQLLPHINDLDKTYAAYKKSHELQLRIRGIRLDLDESIRDMIHVCKFLTLTRDTAEVQTALLDERAAKTMEYYRICEKGLTRFYPFIAQNNVFTWENLRETVATIAFATKLMGQKRGGAELLLSAIEASPRIAQNEAVIDKMIKEITSQSIKERWHIDTAEIKENPILVVYWYGYWNPEGLAEYLMG